MANDIDIDVDIQEDPVLYIEHLAKNISNLAPARAEIRNWFLGKLNEPATGMSIADALSEMVRKSSTDHAVAVMLIRALSIRGLLPEPNSTNQLTRLVVEICELKAPNLCAFLNFPRRAQNYEKFSLLETGHEKFCEPLEPLKEKYGDLQSLVSSRKNIMGALNHSVVKSYCSIFGVQELKRNTEYIFGHLNKVISLESTFLQDFEECQRALDEAREALNANESFLSEYFGALLDTAEELLNLFLKSVRAKYHSEIAKAWGPSETLQRRYPLHEEGREFHIVLPLRNEGNGLAIDVRIEIICADDPVFLARQSLHLGSVKPGNFSIVLDAMVMSACSGFDGIAEVRWTEIGNPEIRSATFDFRVNAQRADVDWNALQLSSPYSTNVAEGDNFIGRSDLVRQLSNKLLRNPMEPFYITGQKRVGKTSLALAATSAVQEQDPDSARVHYILWGDVAHADPTTSLRLLGESIESFIRINLPSEINIPQGRYDGSLAPLISLSDVALQFAPNKKFIIILDEFDEIPQELFLQGNLADTFFANLRSLSRRKNIGLVLVGGENMPFVMERQGQKLNNFSRHNLSYFSRANEWADFQEMIRKPVDNDINWHEDAVSEVFNLSNGNPYFAKILCARIFENAVYERDTDITVSEVKLATGNVVSSLGANSFAHLWQDGIPRPSDEKEPYVLRRSRVLVAVARTRRQSKELTKSEIFEHKTSPNLSEGEINAVLNDFTQRNVLKEHDGTYSFVLPIFEIWLADIGIQQLIADSLNEELANIVLAEENKAAVKSQEITDLVRNWPTYRGQHIGTDDVRAWYQQVESPREQRILFTLLQRTKFYSEALIRERLESVFGLLRSSLPVHVIKKKNERRKDILVTYVDGAGKSGAAHASVFAETNRIAASSVVAPSDFRTAISERPASDPPIAAVIMVDDIAGTGKSLALNVTDFVDGNKDLLQNIAVKVITLVATQTAQEKILSEFEKLEDFDVDFRTCEILPTKHYALPADKSGFSSEDEWERAKSTLTHLGSRIDRKRPLGFGQQGLLVVFPTNVPNNTLPIIRSRSRGMSTTPWYPIFERITH